MYTDDELAKLGFDAYHLGEPVDAVVVQADHAEYRELSAEGLPGRARSSSTAAGSWIAARFDGVRFLVVGQAEKVG